MIADIGLFVTGLLLILLLLLVVLVVIGTIFAGVFPDATERLQVRAEKKIMRWLGDTDDK